MAALLIGDPSDLSLDFETSPPKDEPSSKFTESLGWISLGAFFGSSLYRSALYLGGLNT